MIVSGGLVNIIPKKEVFSLKSLENIPIEVFNKLNLLQMPISDKINSSVTSIYGSSRLKIQPYYGDIDSINIVRLNEINFLKTCKIIEKELKERITTILCAGHFVTDIKCGRYQKGDSKGKAIHWTVKEIFNNFRDGSKKDINGNIGESIDLLEAIGQNHQNIPGGEPAMIKIDMIAPFANRYMEITTVYLIVNDNDNYFFFPNDYLESNRILSSLIDDIEKQKIKNRPFKIVKRLFSILRLIQKLYNNDKAYKYVKFLVPIIGTNISRVSSVYSDLGNLLLLYETNQKNIDIKFASNSIQFLKDKFNVITDLNSIRKNLNIIEKNINNISDLILENKDYKKIENSIKTFMNDINSYIVSEINEYSLSNNITFEKYINIVLNFARKILKGKQVTRNFFGIEFPQKH